SGYLTKETARNAGPAGPAVLASSEHRRQYLSGAAGRLSNTLGRRHEGDSEEAFPSLAECRARHHDHTLLLQKTIGKLRTWEPLGQRHPEVHRGLRRLGLEPCLTKRFHRGIAPAAKHLNVARDEVLVF